MTQNNWGYDMAAMDKSVRPQDDFYHFANGAWLKNNAIPAEESRWGSFSILRHTTEKQVHALVQDLIKKKKVTKGSEEQLVRDMFLSGMDEKRREKQAATPLIPYQKIIASIHDQTSLVEALGKLHALGITAPWGFAVDQDSKNSEKNVLHFYQDGLGLPDKEYYLKNDAEFLRVRKAYTPFIEKLFTLVDRNAKAAQHDAEIILKVETLLAKNSMDKVTARDAEKTYHKKSLAELKKLVSFDWARYFKTAQIPQIPYVILMQPEFLRYASTLVTSLTPEEWRVYLEWHLILQAAPYLSKDFVEANFNFYSRTLMGTKNMRPLWRRVLAATNGTAGFALGKLYIKHHFGVKAKTKMNVLVNDLFAAYEARMHALDWMTPGTKKKAIQKLRMVSRKIGYPTKWRSYKGLIISPTDYFGNIIRAGEHSRKREMKKLKKKVDRTEWHMTPQTVNAYCNFNLNEIVFPAAILQYPFFDAKSDAAVNYGAIGSVIGHELTHAFDDQGSKFDGKGNMKSWWTAADRKHFEKKAAVLVKQFSSFTVHGIKVNGKLTLGENIADLGGAVIAYDALQKHLEKNKRVIIDGFTPEQRFFLGFAQQEQELIRPELQKTTALNDPHSPALFRINGILTHMPEFYAAFGVTPKDKMYLPTAKRAKIW
jgi:putative endopeptidase